MIFRPELAEAVMRGEKTATRRLASDNPRSPWWHGGCRYIVGQGFPVQPGRGKTNIGTALIDRVAMERLGALTQADATREGFPTTQHFFEAWKKINGGFDALAWVWVIEFHLPGSEIRP